MILSRISARTLLLSLSAILATNKAFTHTIESLTKIQNELRATTTDNISISFPSLPGHDRGRYYRDSAFHFEEAYSQGLLDNYTHGDPIIIYSATVKIFHGTGNRLGDYFHAISCAESIGFHFIAIIFEDKIHPNFYLPTVRVGKDPPSTKIEGLTRLSRCGSSNYPWMHPGPWSDHVPLIAGLFKGAMESVSFFFNWDANRLSVQDVRERNSIATVKGIANLPLVPNATIHLRCLDMVFYSMAEGRAMGILNFNIYPLIIPKNVQYLYVMAEDIDKFHDKTATKICHAVSVALMEFLELHFPESAILFHRGHHYESMYILYRSPIIVCSPSTFCLWPAVSKMSSAEKGLAYYTPSWVVLGSAPLYVHDHFYLIPFPKVLSFGHRHVDIRNETAVAAIVKAVLTDPATDVDN